MIFLPSNICNTLVGPQVGRLTGVVDEVRPLRLRVATQQEEARLQTSTRSKTRVTSTPTKNWAQSFLKTNRSSRLKSDPPLPGLLRLWLTPKSTNWDAVCAVSMARDPTTGTDRPLTTLHGWRSPIQPIRAQTNNDATDVQPMKSRWREADVRRGAFNFSMFAARVELCDDATRGWCVQGLFNKCNRWCFDSVF